MLRLERPNVRWTTGSLILTSAIIFWAVLKHYEWKNQVSVERAELRRKAEPLTFEEFDKMFLPHAQPDEVTPRLNALAKRLTEHYYSGELATPVSPGWDAPAWTFDAPDVRGLSNGWLGMAVEVAKVEPVLAKIRLLLLSSKFGSGYICESWDSESSYISYWAAQELLQFALMSDLHQGKFAEAGSDLNAKLALVRLGQERVTLVSIMARVAQAEDAYDGTWAFLAATNSSDSDLKNLQSAWSSIEFVNRVIPTQAAQLVNAEDLEQNIHSEGPYYFINKVHKFVNEHGIPSKSRLAISADTRIDFAINAMIEPAASVTGSDTVESGLTNLQEAVERLQIGSRTIGALDQSIYELLYGYLLEYRDHVQMLKDEKRSLADARAAVADKSWKLARALHQKSVDEDDFAGEQPSIDRLIPENMSAFGHINFIAYEYIFRAETLRQLAIAAIAIKRYQLHNGHLPATLNALVPGFLDSVPVDYMDGKELRYRLDSSDQITLYSVGTNGTDEGGDPCPQENFQSFGKWDGQDIIWSHVAKKAPATLPKDLGTEVLSLVQFNEIPGKAFIENLLWQMGLRKCYWLNGVGTAFEAPIKCRYENTSPRAILEVFLATNHVAAYVAPEATNIVVLQSLPQPLNK
jgi:hypothetical protein